MKMSEASARVFVLWRIDRKLPRVLDGSFAPMPLDPAVHRSGRTGFSDS